MKHNQKKYYTDWHDVDEELRTITILGGFWSHGDFAGFYDRSMDNSGLEEYSGASKKINRPIQRWAYMFDWAQFFTEPTSSSARFSCRRW